MGQQGELLNCAIAERVKDVCLLLLAEQLFVETRRRVTMDWAEALLGSEDLRFSIWELWTTASFQTWTLVRQRGDNECMYKEEARGGNKEGAPLSILKGSATCLMSTA